MDLMNGNLLEEEPRFNIRPRPIDVSIQMPVLQLDKICEICLSEEPTDMTCEECKQVFHTKCISNSSKKTFFSSSDHLKEEHFRCPNKHSEKYLLPRESSKNGVSLILTPHFRQIVESVEQNEFVLPKDYITYDHSHNFIPGGSAEYELDSDDERFLKSLNKRWSGELSEELFEEMIDIFEIEAFKRKGTINAYDLHPRPPGSEEEICFVCNDTGCDESNMIVFCDKCNVPVHQSCYGIPEIPDSEWYCAPCKAGFENVKCTLCNHSGGAMKRTTDNEWAHLVCALWIPDVHIADPDTMEPIINQTKRKNNSVCYICQREGACVECKHRNCEMTYHPSCALNCRLYMEMKTGRDNTTIFESFCAKHSLFKIRNEELVNRSKPIDIQFFENVSSCSSSISLIHKKLGVAMFCIDPICNYWLEKRKQHPLPLLRRLTVITKDDFDNDEQERYQKKKNALDTHLILCQLRKDLLTFQKIMSLVKSREEFKKAYLQTISKLYYRQFNGKLPSSFNLDNCYLNIDLSRYQSGDEEKDNGANNTKTSRKVPEKEEEEDDTEYSSSSSSSSSPSTSSESFVSSDSEMKKKRKVKQSKEESSDSANSDSSNTSEEEEEEESSEEKSESKKSKVKSYIPLKNGIKRRKVHSVSPTNSVKKLPLSSRKEKSPTKPKEEEKEKNQKLKRSNESSPLIEEPNSNSPSKKQKTTEKTSPTSQPPKIIRTSSKSNTIEEDNEIGEVLEGHCHHCKKRRPRCAVCPKNKRHRFCSSCIAKHFGMDYEELIEESPAVIWKLSGCPKCQGKCPCAQCTKTKEKRKAISN